MRLKILRVVIILGALGSLLMTTALLLIGAAFSLTDRFNGPHTRTLAGIILGEMCLLAVLWRVYRRLR
jgi:hypothetical protein